MSSKVTILFEKLSPEAQEPKRSRSGDAGFDLYSIEDIELASCGSCTIKTGIALALPDDTVGLIWPRSGLSVKHDIETGAGVIDSNYRGEISVKLYNHGSENYKIAKGDRVAQLLIIPLLPVALSEGLLDSTERGTQWAGSSGN